MEYIDSYRHKGLRKKMIDTLMSKGIKDDRVLDAMSEIPRHFFLDPMFAEWAYKDVPFPIDSDQTISQPYTVAFQTMLLEVKKGDKIMEIGTGSGYQATVLSHLGAKVYTIERYKSLHNKTSELLQKIGYGRIRTLHGDGYLGLERYAPFDKIIVTAGASEIPTKLLKQLKIGGIMVIPFGKGEVKDMLRLRKVDDKTIQRESFGKFRFVPFVKGVVK